MRPFPIANLRHILAVAIHIAPMLDQLVSQELFEMPGDVAQPLDAIEVGSHCLQTDRHAVIGEGELHMRQVRFATKIARRIDPHRIERGQRALAGRYRPRLAREEV